MAATQRKNRKAGLRSLRYDVFLSHSTSDKADVEILAKRLEDEALIKPFLDKWHLVPGDPWQDALETALDSSDTCAVFLGAEGLGPWENEEMRAALADRVSNKSIRVIPVLLPGADEKVKKNIPRFLSRYTWVDFRGGIDDEDGFSRLVAGITNIAPGRNLGKIEEKAQGLQPSEPVDNISENNHQLGKKNDFYARISDFVSIYCLGHLKKLNWELIVSISFWCFVAVAIFYGWWTYKGYSSLNLATDLLESGEYNKALAAFNQCIEINGSTEAYLGRGRAFLGKGDYDQAINDFSKAVTLKPDHGEAYKNLTDAFSKKDDSDQAIVNYNKSIDLKPDYLEAYKGRARSHRKKKDFEHALYDCNQIIDLEKHSAASYNFRGVIYDEKEDKEHAEADYNQAIKLFEDDDRYNKSGGEVYYQNRGNFYEKNENKPAAIADFQKGYELAKNSTTKGKILNRLQQLGAKPIGKSDKPKLKLLP